MVQPFKCGLIIEMSTDTRAVFFSSLTIGLWGLWSFWGKMALERKMAPPAIFLVETLMTTALAIPVFVALVYWQKSVLFSFNRYGVLSGAALAFGVLCYYFALAEGRVSIIVPLTATYPVVAALLGYALLGERPSRAQWAGILLIIMGAALLLSSSVGDPER
jgi:bacterial/archaeal transporter family protein